jgi:glycerol-3-phosphate acyltransferase PlsX
VLTSNLSVPVIAIDAMGGDSGPHCIVPACVASLTEFPSLHLVLVGHSHLLEEIATQHPGVDRSRLEIVHAGEVIGMSDRLSSILRGKPDSSMRVALELVREGRVGACVSAGNTGALMAISKQLLDTLPGVDRPAMVAALPTSSQPCHVLDLGANVDCSAEQLYQFAVMGSVAVETLGCVRPRVALLNVGTEPGKGNLQVRRAAEMLEASDAINYVGFVEGDDVYQGKADVIVCDGFVGNVLLKASEGLAKMIIERVRTMFSETLGARMVGSMALPLLNRLQEDLAPSSHNGASLLGLRGIVVKSHGAAGAEGFQSAIRRAVREINEDLPRRLHRKLEALLDVGREPDSSGSRQDS